MTLKKHFETLVQRWENGNVSPLSEFLGDESLVHLSVNGNMLTSLLASNSDLNWLLIGHLFTEYQINIASPNNHIQIEQDANGITVNVDNLELVVKKKRSELVVSSCGACDQDNLNTLVDSTPNVTASSKLYQMEELMSKLDEMKSKQEVFSKTGGVHASGILMDDDSFAVMEDIGRHNAVDKVIGHALSIFKDARIRALFLSGRCGWDIVSKAAHANIPVIVSVGAASSLAAQTAREVGLTLVSFVRDGKSIVIGPFQGRFDTKD